MRDLRGFTADFAEPVTSFLLAFVASARKVNLLLQDRDMGSTTILLSIVAVVLMVSYCEASGNCPLPSKVYGCSPKCVQDYECGNGKVCCNNACNAKSCTIPAANGSGSSSSSKSQSGAGIYCDNVKCNSFEVCKVDPKTKRNKCSRP